MTRSDPLETPVEAPPAVVASCSVGGTSGNGGTRFSCAPVDLRPWRPNGNQPEARAERSRWFWGDTSDGGQVRRGAQPPTHLRGGMSSVEWISVREKKIVRSLETFLFFIDARPSR